MLHKQIIKIFLLSAVVLVAGCDSRQPDEPGKVNSIELLDIQPPLDKPLKVGDVIYVRAKVSYVLESKAATVTLAILRTDGFGSKSLTSTFDIIHQGKGELELKGEFIVPKTNMLQVRIPIMPQQRNDSAPFVSKIYKVVE